MASLLEGKNWVHIQCSCKIQLGKVLHTTSGRSRNFSRWLKGILVPRELYSGPFNYPHSQARFFSCMEEEISLGMTLIERFAVQHVCPLEVGYICKQSISIMHIPLRNMACMHTIEHAWTMHVHLKTNFCGIDNLIYILWAQCKNIKSCNNWCLLIRVHVFYIQR